MKSMLNAYLTGLVLMATCCDAALSTYENDVLFSGDVYLSDNTNATLASRIPSGASMSLSGNTILPTNSAYLLLGNLHIGTNRTLYMSSKPDDAASTNSVILSSDGSLLLNTFVSGSGWVSLLLTPTNPPLYSGASNVTLTGTFSGDGSGLTNVPISATLAITNGQTNVTLSGTFSGDGSGLTNVPQTALDGRAATNHVDMGGHAISNAYSIGVHGDKTSESGEVRFYNDQGFIGSMKWDSNGVWSISNKAFVLSSVDNNLCGGSITGATAYIGSSGLGGQYPSNMLIRAGDKSSGSPEKGGNLYLSGGTFYGSPTTASYYGYTIMDRLPTNDPGVAGALWRVNTNLYISTGP